MKFLPGNNVGYFGPYEHRFRGRLRCASDGSCSAGRSVIGIEANGDIKGCPSLPTRGWVGGNVRDHQLRDIWQRAQALRYTREHEPERLWGFCASCYYAEECRGGCTHRAGAGAKPVSRGGVCAAHRAGGGFGRARLRWRSRVAACAGGRTDGSDGVPDGS